MEWGVNSWDGGGGSHISRLWVTHNTCHYHTHAHRHISKHTYVQWFTEPIAWSQIRRKQTTIPNKNPNHFKTMIQFTKQHPYSVSDPSCYWEARAQQKWRELVGYWSWKTERRGERNSNRVECLHLLFTTAKLATKQSKSVHCQDTLTRHTPRALSYGKMCLCTSV